jgi:hypothetical protein
MQKLIGLALAGLCICATAQAAEAPKGCFQMNFTKAWLKKVEKQFVTSIQIDTRKAAVTSEPPGIVGKLSAKFRDDKELWWHTDFECLDGGESWACSTHCDGGTFILTKGKKGLQIVNQRFLKFNRPERSECDKEPRFVYADIEHTTFNLPQITSKACAKK